MTQAEPDVAVGLRAAREPRSDTACTFSGMASRATEAAHAQHGPGRAPAAHLPAGVMQLVVCRADQRGLRALHLVAPGWREAVCLSARALAPASCDLAMLRRFPRVRELSFSHAVFTEPQLAELGGLTALALSECTFHHSLKALSALEGLESCSLRDMRCSGGSDMEAFLCSQTALTHLELLRTGRQSKMPACNAVPAMTRLRELVIDDGQQQAQLAGLTQLSGLTALRRLRLAGVGVATAALRGLSCLRGLHSLELPECRKLSDHALIAMAELTGLTKLDLRSVKCNRARELSDAGATRLSGLTALCSLDLAGHSSLTASGLGFLSRCKQLSQLSFSGTDLTEGAPFLASLTALQRLDLSKTRAACGFLATALLAGLTELNLSTTQLGDDSAPYVARMARLASLDISCTAVSGAGLLQIVRGCPALQVVAVDGCPVSVLAMLAAVRARPALRMWEPGAPLFPTWTHQVSAVLTAQRAPCDFTLRVLHCGEDSAPLTAAVLAGSLAFCMLYALVLVGVFLCSVVPLGVFGIACMLGAVLRSVAGALSQAAACAWASTAGRALASRAVAPGKRTASDASSILSIADMV